MAEIFPNEGLDYLLGIVPKGATTPATLYLGLFTGGSAATVPGATATLAAMGGTFSEASGPPSYARVAVAAADWGTVGNQTIWGTAYRSVVAAQKSFQAATAPYATAINGFFLATALTGGVAVYYSNFDDETAIASLALGDIIRVTPKFGLGG